MKKKLVENTKPIPTRRKGYWTTVQVVEDILILNMYNDRKLYARHCFNTRTKEYATFELGEWNTKKIEGAFGLDPEEYTYYWSGSVDREICKKAKMSPEDKKLIRKNVEVSSYYRNIYENSKEIRAISAKESEYASQKRETRERNRYAKVKAMMNRIPDIPEGIKEWINQKELGGMDFLTKSKDEMHYTCSRCGRTSDIKDIKKEDGDSKVRDKDIVICPKCRGKVQIRKRKKELKVKTHFSMIQPIDNEVSVARHFTAYIECKFENRKRIEITEDVRIVLFKESRYSCEIYYEQCSHSEWVPDGGHHEGYFDNKGNHWNKREFAGFLYDAGIEEALKGTHYENWTRLFTQMAKSSQKLNYNRMMCAAHDQKYIDLMEMLFKGRFYELLQEQSERVYTWDQQYHPSILKHTGSSIEQVLGIFDRQMINRIRDRNGGEDMVEWMQWSERNKQRISDKTLDWIVENGLSYQDMQWMKTRFTLEQAKNYIERQRKESYPGWSAKAVIGQYEDYMSMCQKLKKKIMDEMIYRPRELKRRHDEAVLEIQRLEAQIKADEYSKKYSEAEKVLAEIKDKFEYRGENYIIVVPSKIVDIVLEGRALHHCVANTDRYFDRIKSHETYICFCRKADEPEKPFYTIEVEPGGTIRQHRGKLDEKPEIEQVKVFLREWQREIKKRMSKEDIERAKISKNKRQENIDELKEKNNTRVLEGLMEDFMEAV